jgi:superfamily II DNA helicase RecQ
MPTGAGKSILFMLPASVGIGGVTVVVVPFVTLRYDIKGRSEKISVSVGE